MHAAELDSPVAELYVPVELGGEEKSRAPDQRVSEG